MKKSILLAVFLSAFVGALIVSSTAHACGDGSNDIVLINGELPGGG